MDFNILVVDDDKDIVEAVAIYLNNENLNVFKAYNGLEALEVLAENEIHLILMDIMMPEMDGMKATMKIRESEKIPIIMLSAKSEFTDKILGLNIGADDYITKPFNALELVARVKSQLRRYTQLGAMEQAGDNQLMVGGLCLDKDAKTLTVDGDMVKLTPMEYKILAFLMENAGKVFSIDQIYEQVWNEPSYNAENTVAVHVRKIREKIEINPREPKYLKVVWGIGYKIEKLPPLR